MRFGTTLLAAAAALSIAASPVSAGGGGPKAAAPKGVKKSARFSVMQIEQAERDLSYDDPRINVMVDAKTGRSWVLRYTRMPGSEALGYVWVEIPMRRSPKADGK